MNSDLSALISSRICHDLINPLGAISNGMELLDTLGTTPGPELELVAESAARATAKLNYLRIAFGDIARGSDLKGSAVAVIVQNMFSVGRFKVNWPDDVRALTRLEAKLVLLSLLAAESSAPLGGTCTITRGDNWNLSVSAARITPDTAAWQMACGGPELEEVSASNVHFAALASTLAETGYLLTWRVPGDRLEISLTHPA